MVSASFAAYSTLFHPNDPPPPQCHDLTASCDQSYKMVCHGADLMLTHSHSFPVDAFASSYRVVSIIELPRSSYTSKFQPTRRWACGAFLVFITCWQPVRDVRADCGLSHRFEALKRFWETCGRAVRGPFFVPLALLWNIKQTKLVYMFSHFCAGPPFSEWWCLHVP